MSRFNFHGSLLSFTALIAFALAPTFAFAQHGGGGGGGHAGGGGGFGGGGHAGGGGFGGGGYHGGGGYGGGSHGAGYGGGYHGGYGGSEGRGFGSRGYSGGSSGFGRGGYGEGMKRGGMEGSRASAPEFHSNYSRGVNDGQWHSFNGGGAASHSAANTSHSAANTSHFANNSHSTMAGSSAHSTSIASNHAIADGGWHSFGTSHAGFGAAGYHAGYGWHGNYGYRGYYGYGWRGYGWGCCGWGWGGWGWGFGWGWGGWGWGWPYWGFYWGPGWGYWNAWWWNPYWYAPYGYYPNYYNGPYDYGYDDSVQPPYRPPDNQNQIAPSNQNPTNNVSPSADTTQSLTSFATGIGPYDPLAPDASRAPTVQVPFAANASAGDNQNLSSPGSAEGNGN